MKIIQKFEFEKKKIIFNGFENVVKKVKNLVPIIRKLTAKVVLLSVQE